MNKNNFELRMFATCACPTGPSFGFTQNELFAKKRNKSKKLLKYCKMNVFVPSVHFNE